MGNIIKKVNNCRLCKNKNLDVLFVKEKYEIVKCQKCDLIFLNFDPDSEFLKHYYSEDFFNDPGIKHAFSNYEEEAPSLKKTFTDRIARICKYVKNGTLLDIGCATGTFLEAAASYWKVCGVDVSDYAILQARTKGLEAYTGEIQNISVVNTSRFDVVTLWDTIEHVADPGEVIKYVNKIVLPGGVVALSTGDVGSVFSKLCGRYWHLYNIPQHLSFFDKTTITTLLEENGFKIMEITYQPSHLTLDYLLFRFITFYKLQMLMPIYKYLKEKGYLNGDVKINLYDIMLVIAQK